MKTECKFILGKLDQIYDQYNDFLQKENIEIVSTAITKDWAKFGNSERFVLIVTYKKTFKP